MSNQMKDGYYWVKYEGEWMIVEIEDNKYTSTRNGFEWDIKELDEIGDYIETPDKYKG